MIMPSEFPAASYAILSWMKKLLKSMYEYQRRLGENNSMDFDDLLLKPIKLFNEQSKSSSKI